MAIFPEVNRLIGLWCGSYFVEKQRRSGMLPMLTILERIDRYTEYRTALKIDTRTRQ
jgi:hypothetical protein